MTVTARFLVEAGAGTLKKMGVPDAEFDALQLFRHVSGWDHAGWLLRGNESLQAETVTRYHALLERRAGGEPLQYILGEWSFLGREFHVGPGVLIPRPETEELTELCVRELCRRENAVVYDLCAGSGCIGISIALSCPGTDVYLFELSEDALTYLRKNVPPEAAARIHILRHDIFDDCPPELPVPDLIVSNPPYIPAAELPGLQPEVRREPRSALDGGADGMDFYRRFSAYWLGLLHENGSAAFECGEGQAEAIAAMLPRGFEAQIVNDCFGTARFVLCAPVKKGN